MITRIWIRQLAFLGLAVALLVAGALPGGRAWAEPAEEPSLESIKTTLDEIEEAVGRDDVTQETLVELRQKLNATADTLRGKIDELEPRVNEAEERLKQLGPAPAKDAPPESQEIADQRKELTESFSELDGALKQARVLSVRIEQLSERVSQKRHALYANELQKYVAKSMGWTMKAIPATDPEITRFSNMLNEVVHGTAPPAPVPPAATP